MSGTYHPPPGLDETLAEHVAQPALRQVVDMLTDAAKRGAPDTRRWITMRDPLVRHTHREADGQTIPANLRFLIEYPNRPGEYELARRPGDEALTAGNRYNCRCVVDPIPHLLRDSIHGTDPQVQGTRVTASVETRFPRAAESEVGTSGDEGAHFMSGALRDVAARLRAGQG